MLRTRLCDILGIEFPIIMAPMGFVTGPELAAAVSNAGGLGIMSFSGNPPDEPVIGETKIAGRPVPVVRFRGFPPSKDAIGDIESMNFLMGQGVGLVNEIKPAATVVKDLIEGVERIIRERLNGFLTEVRTRW